MSHYDLRYLILDRSDVTVVAPVDVIGDIGVERRQKGRMVALGQRVAVESEKAVQTAILLGRLKIILVPISHHMKIEKIISLSHQIGDMVQTETIVLLAPSVGFVVLAHNLLIG